MKNPYRLLWLLCLVVPLASCVLAQEAGEVAGEAFVYEAPSRGLFSVILSGGPLGLLNWAGIILWAVLALPLGILSIANSAALRVRQYPVATKLLMVGCAWVFVLGWVGVAQGIISAFSMLTVGAPDITIFAMNMSHALYSVAAALAVCQCYLFFLLISVIIVHVKHTKMLEQGGSH